MELGAEVGVKEFIYSRTIHVFFSEQLNSVVLAESITFSYRGIQRRTPEKRPGLLFFQ